MFKALCKYYFHASGWKIVGSYPRELDKVMVIIGPHTSNLDFIIGVGVRTIVDVDVKYLGKKELFRFPYGWLFRSLGGYPVDRSASHNTVDTVVDIFNSKTKFSLAMSPEGTRKKVEKLKTGFYHIAKKAKLPIVMAGLNYEAKQLVFEEAFYPTDDQNEDFKKIIDFFSKMKGKHPEKGIYDQYL